MNNNRTVKDMEKIIIERTLKARRVIDETIERCEEYIQNKDENAKDEIDEISQGTVEDKLYWEINIAFNIHQELLSLCHALNIKPEEYKD